MIAFLLPLAAAALLAANAAAAEATPAPTEPARSATAPEPAPIAPDVEPFRPTPEQLRDYRAVYENGDVQYLRRILDRCWAGKGGDEGEFLAPYAELLRGKFIVLSRDPALGGGALLTVIFIDQPVAVFQAWVYDRRTSKDRYAVYGFRRLPVSDLDLARLRARYRTFLKDPAHAL